MKDDDKKKTYRKQAEIAITAFVLGLMLGIAGTLLIAWLIKL